MGAVSTIEVKKSAKRAEVKIGGVVTALQLRNTKKGDRYANFVLEDYLGTVESIAWPDVYQQIASIIVADEPVVVSGRADVSDERCTLIVNKLESLVALRDRTATQGVLSFAHSDPVEQRIRELQRLFGKYTGNCPIKVNLEVEGDSVSMVLRDVKQAPICVSPSEKLCEEVEQLFGRPVLSFI
jgi:DNA polymerase-3 subunit alpha